MMNPLIAWILYVSYIVYYFFFFQAEDGIRDVAVTGVQTCALPISRTLRRRKIDNQAVTGVRRHEDQLVHARRQEGGPAQLAERNRAPPPPVHEHGERRPAANRVQHAEARSLARRWSVPVVASGKHHETGADRDNHARLHCSRSTMYTVRCTVGMLTRARMFTCSGRLTMYAIASATSSALSGFNP